MLDLLDLFLNLLHALPRLHGCTACVPLGTHLKMAHLSGLRRFYDPLIGKHGKKPCRYNTGQRNTERPYEPGSPLLSSSPHEFPFSPVCKTEKIPTVSDRNPFYKN